MDAFDPIMTSHPSPDGISERVDALEARLKTARFLQKNAIGLGGIPSEAPIALLLDAMIEDATALCTLVRGASEATKHAADLVARINLLPQWDVCYDDLAEVEPPHGRCFKRADVFAAIAESPLLRAAIDAARTPNQDSPNGR